MLFTKSKVKIHDEKDNIIYSPFTGKVVPLEQVNDPVFSSKTMGEGIAIVPKDGYVYSPVSGTVSFIFPTKHAIGISDRNGIGIIIHIGIETVYLNGNGFDVKVKQGQTVQAGQLIMKIDLNKIKEKYDPTTMIVFDQKDEIQLQYYDENECVAGQKIMSYERKI